jgi:hypothetical protein
MHIDDDSKDKTENKKKVAQTQSDSLIIKLHFYFILDP